MKTTALLSSPKPSPKEMAFFWFLGNPTLGYVATPSIFGWMHWVYQKSPDDSHGWLIPFVVAGLFWLAILLVFVLSDYFTRGWLPGGHWPS